MVDWYYKGKIVRKAPPKAYGFIYRIVFGNGDFYLGKKSLYHRTNPQISKKKYDELKAAGKPVTKTKNKKLSKPGKPVWRYKQKNKITESNWKTYNSSSDVVKARIKAGEIFTKTIISYHNNSKELTYRELEAIIKANALDRCDCLNSNILSKFFNQVKC